jgi:hypothetical protein
VIKSSGHLITEVIDMAIQFAVENGNLGIFRVNGKLGVVELEAAQKEAEEVIKKEGDIRILVVLENFAGWEKAKGWGDISFPLQNDPYIKKIAIVGDAEWRDLVYAFTGKGLREVPIEYFEANREDAARQWLDIA